MNKLRWGKFYWSDWADDPALALCSLSAQGLWMRLLCIAAQGTPYGHVTVNGKPPSTADLAKLIRPKPKPGMAERLVAELEHRGVAYRADCGCLVSRRMEADGKLATVRSKAARKMHAGRSQDSCRSPTGVLQESYRTPTSKPERTDTPLNNNKTHADLHMQNASFASTELEAELEAEPPLLAPPIFKRRRKSKEGGWTTLAQEEVH